MRTCKRLSDGVLETVEFNELVKGDLFMLIDDINGEKYIVGTYEAKTDPYINRDGIWQIDIKGDEEVEGEE